MCNYPEESSRPLSSMECQNAFDQMVAKTEPPNAVDPIAKEPLRIVDRKPTDDPNFDEIKFNREPTFSEVKLMCSDEGISIEDETIPTLTKETIENATEAFDDMPTDEAQDVDLDEGEVVDVNEASNTELLEEDAPDEGVEEPNPVKEAFAKVAKEVDQQLKDECEGNCIKCENHCHDKVDVKVPSEDDKFKATCAIKYLHEKEIGQDNAVDHLDIIDDVYTTLTETQRKLVTDSAPCNIF